MAASKLAPARGGRSSNISATVAPTSANVGRVPKYNTYIKKMPANLTARMFGFTEQKYFEAPKEAQQVPKVQF